MKLKCPSHRIGYSSTELVSYSVTMILMLQACKIAFGAKKNEVLQWIYLSSQ
jgi:hypothetical protein